MSAPDLQERYGRPSASRRRLVIAGSGLLGALGLTWVGWVAWVESTPEVQSVLRTFEVVDQHTVRATVSVKTRSTDVRASCRIIASAADKSPVGEVTFRVRGTGGTVEQQVRLRTERAATAVNLQGCTTPNQGRPR